MQENRKFTHELNTALYALDSVTVISKCFCYKLKNEKIKYFSQHRKCHHVLVTCQETHECGLSAKKKVEIKLHDRKATFQ